MLQTRAMAVGKVEQESYGERKLIVRGLPTFVTDAMLFQALKLNQHIVSLHIQKHAQLNDTDRTGVVVFQSPRDAQLQLNISPVLHFGDAACACALDIASNAAFAGLEASTALSPSSLSSASSPGASPRLFHAPMSSPRGMASPRSGRQVVAASHGQSSSSTQSSAGHGGRREGKRQSPTSLEPRSQNAAEPSLHSGVISHASPLPTGGPLMSLGGSLGSRSVKRSRSSDGSSGTRLSYVAQQQLAHRTTLTPATILAHVQTLSTQGQHFAAYRYFLEHLELFNDPVELESTMNKLLANSRMHWLSISPHLGNQSNLVTPVHVSFEGGHLITTYGIAQPSSPSEISSARTPQESIDDSSSSSATAASSSTSSSSTYSINSTSQFRAATEPQDAHTTALSEVAPSRPPRAIPPLPVPAQVSASAPTQHPSIKFSPSAPSSATHPPAALPEAAASDSSRSIIESAPSTSRSAPMASSEPNSPKSNTAGDQSPHTIHTQAAQMWDSPRFSHPPPLMAASHAPLLHSTAHQGLMNPMTQMTMPLHPNYVDNETDHSSHAHPAHMPSLLHHQHHNNLVSHSLDASQEMQGHYNHYYGFPNPTHFDPSLMAPHASSHLGSLPSGSSPPNSSILTQDYRPGLSGSHQLSLSPPSVSSVSGSGSFYADVDMFAYGHGHTSNSDEYFHWSPNADA